MKRFSFRLDRVARVRQIQRDLAQAELARARCEQTSLEARLQALRDHAAADAAGFGVGRIQSPTDVRAAAFRASQRARAAEMAMIDLARASAEAEAATDELLDANRRVEGLAKLEQRHHEDWAVELRREESVVLDDIATTRAARGAQSRREEQR